MTIEKYLITGYSGFVSQHFLNFLESSKEKSIVLGVDINSPDFDITCYKSTKLLFEKLDLLDKDAVNNLIYNFQPDYILHLASYSSVAYSWKNPLPAFVNNTNIFLNLVEQVRMLESGSQWTAATIFY